MSITGMRGARRLAVAGLAGVAALAVGVAANPAAASSSGSASVANDTLTVTGANGSDRIALRLAAGASTTLQVDFGDDGVAEHEFDRNTFSKIEVSTGNGADQFRVDEVNGAFADEAATIDGGNGSDRLDGGAGNEVFVEGRGNDAVDGNRGADTAHLGSGEDSFRWDPGDGSDVVEGQSGTDTLVFNGASGNEVFSLSPNGRRSLFLRDLGNIRMDMDDVEQLDLAALEGVDTTTINDMSGTDFRRADVDLSRSSGGGDGQSDTVTVNGTEDRDRLRVSTRNTTVEVRGLQAKVAIAGAETNDLLQVNSLGGNDTVDVDDDVNNVIGVAVDLGSGQR